MEMEWRLVKKYGKVFLEARYKGESWNELHPWLFPADTKPHHGWAYMAEFRKQDQHNSNVIVYVNTYTKCTK